MSSHSTLVYDEAPKTPTRQKSRPVRKAAPPASDAAVRSDRSPQTSPTKTRPFEILSSYSRSFSNGGKSGERIALVAVDPHQVQSVAVDGTGKENKSILEVGGKPTGGPVEKHSEAVAALQKDIIAIRTQMDATTESLSSLEKSSESSLRSMNEEFKSSSAELQQIHIRMDSLERSLQAWPASAQIVSTEDIIRVELQIVANGQQTRAEMEELRSALREIAAAAARRVENDTRLERLSNLFGWLESMGETIPQRLWKFVKILSVLVVLFYMWRWRRRAQGFAVVLSALRLPTNGLYLR